MKTVTPTELRMNIYKLLDEILASGVPLEINKGGKKLKIVPVEQPDKFQNLITRDEVIQGDPEDIVEISWEKEVNLDLP
ncbi:MAG TPA: type II toxin-antitoxin system Phd/YefM family antitoxin [Anaerolineae bacterium]|nr:type II toxin-antitoxin system Phd/YefM family antitoxin [Anaerolineae bacterium]